MNQATRQGSASGPTRLAIAANAANYHVQKWARKLTEQGLEVTLVSFHPPGDPIQGVSYRPLTPPARIVTDRVSLIDFRLAAGALRSVLREESIEVLLASYATNYGWTAALSGFHPTILQTWTYDVSVYPVSSWKRLFLAPIVRRALRHADAITTDGQPLADFLCERFSVEHAKVTSLLWGIQVEDFATDPNRRRAVRATLGIYDDAPVVLSHRGVHSRYAPAEVLDALIAYLNDDSSVHALALTLEHGRSKSVQDRLDRLESHPRGHVVDKFLSRDRMADIWSAADVFISVPPRDGISVSALEGMAVGVVPIVTDIESNRALFGRDRARYISDPKSELYEAIRDVISDLPNWRRHVVELNKEWVREHGSVEVAAGRLASLAEALAKRDIHGASKR